VVCIEHFSENVLGAFKKGQWHFQGVTFQRTIGGKKITRGRGVGGGGRVECNFAEEEVAGVAEKTPLTLSAEKVIAFDLEEVPLGRELLLGLNCRF